MTLRPSQTRQFDLIAFDWDGTLFDSTALIARCIQRAAVDIIAPADKIPLADGVADGVTARSL